LVFENFKMNLESLLEYALPRGHIGLFAIGSMHLVRSEY
jgi:hypothetical protein